MPVNLDLLRLLPEVVLVSAALLVLLVDLFLGEERKSARLGALTVLGLAASALAIIPAQRRLAELAGQPLDFAGGMLTVDTYALIFKAIFFLGAALVALSAIDYVERRKLPVGEFYQLILFATLGMSLMASSRDALTIYLGLELTSISSYVLAGLLRGDRKSTEAAIKYFLNGALASAVLLFGLSLLYGLAGTTNLDAIGFAMFSGTGVLGWIALVFVLVGLGFKIALAPFHLWAPDVYEGAPTPVTAFFSIGPKAGYVAAFVRVFILGLFGLSPQWQVVLGALAILSMVIGNVTALMQTNIKRMMAYSSIGHAGYLMVGLAVATQRGVAAIVLYLVAYVVTNVGLFAVITALDARGEGSEVRNFAGLSQRNPMLAAAMVVFLLSLVGVPPTGVFFGKFFLFSAAIDSIGRNPLAVWLAVSIAVNSAISVWYYYGVLRQMYLVPAEDGERRLVPGGATTATVLLTSVGTLVIGLFGERLWRLVLVASELGLGGR